jgi:L,D-transpeptidase ErfK/SrfK
MLLSRSYCLSSVRRFGLVGALTLLTVAAGARAETYPLPPAGESVIGGVRTVHAQDTDTLVDLARAHGFGYEAIRAANPSVDAWMPRNGTQVVLPSRHILPSGPREGIVVNTAEMRMYYYPKPKQGEKPVVETFPVAIGRGDWRTPQVLTRVSGKVKDPVWYPPESIRREHAEQGDMLPKVVRAGPDNPLGKYALRLTIPSYLIHGTNKQYGVGMQVTHGCIRMYPEHIERVFQAVPVGTPVRIVYEPVKVGWQGGQLFMEIHPPLDGVPAEEFNSPTPLLNAITNATKARPDYPVDWQQVQVVKLETSGLPTPIGPALFVDALSSSSSAAADNSASRNN